MPEALLWNLEEAARQLGGVSPRTVRRLIERGELPTVRVGARLLVPSGAVADWIANRQTVTYARPSVGRPARGTGPCPTEKTKTASTGAGIPRTGGPATPMRAARELAAVLKLPTDGKPKAC